MKWAEKIVLLRFEPVRCIEWVVSGITLLGGLYVFTPLYKISKATHPGVITQVLSSPLLVYLFAALLVVGSIAVLIGLFKDVLGLRSAGLFTIGLTRAFQLFVTLLTVPLQPIIWIHLLTVTLVIFILWVGVRIEVYEHAR